MKRLFIGVAGAAMLIAGVAHADVIADRKAEMKNNGAKIGMLVKSAKGEIDYDAAAVLDALKSMRATTNNYAELFPTGSATGGETEASPKIWEDMDGFKAKLAAFHAELDAAIAAAPDSKEALQPLVGKIGGTCQGCHETFRLKKS
jgi:cytochrome c556